MRIVCISDTHNQKVTVPDGDLLIHAGDATLQGTVDEIIEFNAWFSALPHKHKIFIAGNHDWLFQLQPAIARSLLDKGVVYLQDSSTVVEGLNIYGSPWQPRFYDWAFNLNRGSEMAEKWELIPAQTDILITHGPPNRILDLTMQGDHAGCEELIKKVEEIRPRVHIFGHIHEGHGTLEKSGTRFVNASNCDEGYRLVNAPIVFDL
jgi:Icc-related predicted phosphoesterase